MSLPRAPTVATFSFKLLSARRAGVGASVSSGMLLFDSSCALKAAPKAIRVHAPCLVCYCAASAFIQWLIVTELLARFIQLVDFQVQQDRRATESARQSTGTLIQNGLTYM